MEVSSTSMKVASVTVIAMIHGLIAGRQMSAFSSGGAAALTGESRPWAQPTRRGEAIDHYLRRDRELSSPGRRELPSHNSRSHFPVVTGYTLPLYFLPVASTSMVTGWPTFMLRS